MVLECTYLKKKQLNIKGDFSLVIFKNRFREFQKDQPAGIGLYNW